jgi:hypothetical protein
VITFVLLAALAWALTNIITTLLAGQAKSKGERSE